MYRGRPVLDYLYWVAVTKRLVHKKKEEKKSVSECIGPIGKTAVPVCVLLNSSCVACFTDRSTC